MHRGWRRNPYMSDRAPVPVKETSMLTQIYPGFYVGDQTACSTPTKAMNRASIVAGIVHCCKAPCHQRAVGYDRALPKVHPEYLVAQRDEHLYLNMIDPPVPLFSVELFLPALDFMDDLRLQGDILVHCNRGLSRAPSLVGLYLAKRLKVWRDDWDKVKAHLLAVMPDYAPGLGIDVFLAAKWGEIK